MTTFNLTATFTPPSECLTDLYRYDANQLVGPMTASCYPQGWTNTTTTFYSPGICPSGYTTACIRADTANTVTETIATCCPTSLDCGPTNDNLGCHSTIEGGISQLITAMNSDFSSISTIHTELIGGYINAYGVQIRFQATDLQHVTSTENGQTSTTATASSTGSTTSSSGASSSSPGASKPSTNLTSHSGLSTGAKAGIGVGAALAVCIGLVLLCFRWRRAKRRRALPTHVGELRNGGEIDGANYTPTEAKHHGLVEMQGNRFPPMQGNGPSEAPGDDLRREIGGHHLAHRHELEGRGR